MPNAGEVYKQGGFQKDSDSPGYFKRQRKYYKTIFPPLTAAGIIQAQ